MPAPTPPPRDWVLVYYMSYDNDLAHHAPTILSALEGGVKNSDLLVTVLQDDKATTGLKRHTLSAEVHSITVLPTDNSAAESVLGNYLAWVAEHYPARHYALCFLDHGGNLDEMCLDESPGQGETKHWLSAQLSGSASNPVSGTAMNVTTIYWHGWRQLSSKTAATCKHLRPSKRGCNSGSP